MSRSGNIFTNDTPLRMNTWLIGREAIKTPGRKYLSKGHVVYDQIILLCPFSWRISGNTGKIQRCLQGRLLYQCPPLAQSPEPSTLKDLIAMNLLHDWLIHASMPVKSLRAQGFRLCRTLRFSHQCC